MTATTRSLIAALRLYQRTLSPDHGWFRASHPYGFCRFEPTCSSYAIEALERFGLVRGVLLATRRLLRCNPYARGGTDPLPTTTR